jgi:endonuclease-3
LTTKIQRIEIVEVSLNKLYPDPPIPLKHKDEFTLLISVLLSAQCTDKRVNKITPILFKLADNPLEMSMLKVKLVENVIRPCGLAPRKAKSIVGLSKIIMDNHDGVVPWTFEELEKMPGVGHKTASVVLAQAYNIPTFPVDTHIHRLAQRWGLTKGKNVKQTESDLKKCFKKENWNKLHLQFIYYGREFCTARGCKGIICNICRTCFPKRKTPFIHNRS